MVAMNYHMGESTLGDAIPQVCNALWERLRPHVLPTPTQATWRYQAEGFCERWGFPNCCGAIDGKHCKIQAPPNSGTSFYNYKGTFSIVLMAVAGFDYRFIYVDIGGYGSSNDSGIFNETSFGKALDEERLDLPPPAALPREPNGFEIPHMFVGDEAFKLSKNLMKPHAQKRNRQLNASERIFNYRLSRARHVVENAFGILAACFRINRRTIQLSPAKADCIVKATVVLHNLLTTPDDCIAQAALARMDAEVEEELSRANLAPLPGLLRARNPTLQVKAIQDFLTEYFSSAEGAVPWQNRSARLVLPDDDEDN